VTRIVGCTFATRITDVAGGAGAARIADVEEATRIILALLAWVMGVMIGAEPRRRLGGGSPTGMDLATGRLVMIGRLPDATVFILGATFSGAGMTGYAPVEGNRWDGVSEEVERLGFGGGTGICLGGGGINGLGKVCLPGGGAGFSKACC